jgi:hypothetical protein
MLQTVLNEKLIFPHFGHVKSLSRVASRGSFRKRKKKKISSQGSSKWKIIDQDIHPQPKGDKPAPFF